MNKTLKKVLLYSLGTFVFLVAVLAVHIYVVYRPKPATATSRIMARMDIKQQITQSDANTITSWMYKQKGIDHVLVNPDSRIVVFTFFPIKTTGNEIVKNFRTSLPFTAERIIPTAGDLKNGCPVAATSYTYKIYKFIAHII